MKNNQNKTIITEKVQINEKEKEVQPELLFCWTPNFKHFWPYEPNVLRGPKVCLLYVNLTINFWMYKGSNLEALEVHCSPTNWWTTLPWLRIILTTPAAAAVESVEKRQTFDKEDTNPAREIVNIGATAFCAHLVRYKSRSVLFKKPCNLTNFYLIFIRYRLLKYFASKCKLSSIAIRICRLA